MNISEHFYRGGGVETCKYILAAAAMAIFAARNMCCAGDLALSIGADSVDVTAAADVLDESSELYLVWGDADCGETLDAWPTDTRAQYTGTIDGTARTYTFDVAVPAGKSVRAIATTGVKILSEGEYITLEDGEYLDTGIKATEACSLAVSLHPTSFSHGYGAIFGSAWNDFGVGNAGNNTSFYTRWQGVFKSLGGGFTMLNGDHTIAVKDNDYYLDVNARGVKGVNTTQSLGTKEVSILLGSTWNADGTEPVYNIVSGEGGYYTNARWYYAILKNSAGTEIAHLVPALNQGSPAFYDKVRKTTLVPSGTGTATASTTEGVFVEVCSAAYLSGRTAWWTGGGDRTNVKDPNNWNCIDGTGATVSGAYPNATTTVNISGETDFQVPAGQTLKYGILNIGDCTLTANCDWRGLGSAAIAGTVALGGNTLTLADAKGAGTITGAGKLVIEVAEEGAAVTNDSLTLTGALQLEKTGKGTFVAAKDGQSYTGGTLVSAGIAKSGAYNGAWGATNRVVTVADGASFDWAGKVNDSTTMAYSFNICGSGVDGKGAIYSSKLIGGESGFYRWNIIADLTLSGDATIETFPDNYADKPQWTGDGFSYSSDKETHNLTLGPHTLTIKSGGRFLFRKVSADGTGSILLRAPDGSTGYRQISVYGGDSNLSTVSFDVADGTGLNMEANMKVLNFTDGRTSRRLEPTGYEKNDGTITVLETFKPCHTQIFSKFALGDATHTATTLDLGDITGEFNVSGNDYTLTFASGSTVTVKLDGTRTDLKTIAKTKDSNGEYVGYILRWGAGNAPSGVSFAVESGLSSKYRIEPKDDGLVLRAKSGMVIVIK